MRAEIEAGGGQPIGLRIHTARPAEPTALSLMPLSLGTFDMGG
jgi:hypothetical protein